MKKYIVSAIIIISFFISSLAHAAITSVTLTPGSPTTMSNGRAYYTAGLSYTFRIQAFDALTTLKANWISAQVTLPGGSSFTIDAATGAVTGAVGVNVTGVTDNLPAGPFTNIDYTITVTFRWDATAVVAGANNVGYVVADINGTATLANAWTFNFGVISDFRVLNFNQTGEAADGMINPWHSAFTVTGTTVYYSAGESISTPIPAGEVPTVRLYLWRGAANISQIGPIAGPGLSYNIGAEYFANAPVSGVLGGYTWDVRATMATGGTTKQSVNSLALNCNRVQVDTFTFENGGGVNSPPGAYYVRSVNVSGTRIRIRASLQDGGGAMVGNTLFRIRDDQATPNYYTLQINSGQNEGTVLVDPMPTVANLNNIAVNYTVVAVYGSAYDPSTAPPAPAPPTSGQNDATRIVNSGPFICRWENHHPPGYPASPFTAQTGTLPPISTAMSFTLQWTALSTAGPSFDADFDTYRIYYKRSSDSTYLILDKNSPGCPACAGTLGTIGAGTVSFTVGWVGAELIPFTAYDYRISAVDVFGNEVLLADQIIGAVTTQVTQIDLSISDGISVVSQESFVGSPDPATHVMRHTAIKVTTKIITAESPPDQVNIIVASNDSDAVGPPPGQWGVTGTADSILDASLVDNVTRWTIPCTKVAANTYEAFIPSEHPLMKNDGNIRMIVATIKNGTPTYSDSRNNPPGNYWFNEWRFRVGQPAIFIPWPTRILNNVLTAQMPCCFPAFFLAVDSLVTIKVYDVKGRVIATLCDRMYRPGGQNIKDLGWCGRNKENRRVGPGLYYIHIKAVTFGNKTVLDKILKVVVRH
jgi:hypothetical protein